MEEENKETPSSPAKSEDSYTQCMSPTSEKKIESIAADDSTIKDVAIATTNENQESLVTKDEEETAVMRTEIAVAIKDTAQPTVEEIKEFESFSKHFPKPGTKAD